MALNRPDYRDPKQPRAVAVYTVAQESRHVMFKNIPALSGKDTIIQDLLSRCGQYGVVESWRLLDDRVYNKEDRQERFTLDPILVQLQTVDQARLVKRKMDDQVFYANLLQVCYAPEFDTVDDLRIKFATRRMAVQNRLASLAGQRKRKRSNDGQKTKFDCQRGKRVPPSSFTKARYSSQPSLLQGNSTVDSDLCNNPIISSDNHTSIQSSPQLSTMTIKSNSNTSVKHITPLAPPGKFKAKRLRI